MCSVSESREWNNIEMCNVIWNQLYTVKHVYFLQWQEKRHPQRYNRHEQGKPEQRERETGGGGGREYDSNVNVVSFYVFYGMKDVLRPKRK